VWNTLNRIHPVHYRVLVTLLGFWITGCSADGYRDQTDRQVQALIRERQKIVTGYTPEIDVGSTTQPVINRKSYDPVPLTRYSTDRPAPIQVVTPSLRVEPLGPPVPDESPLPTIGENVFEDAYRLQRNRLTYGPPAITGDSVKLDLFAAINYAVRNSRSYRDRMEQLYLSALNVTLQRHLFSPRPFVTTDLRYTGSQAASDYASAFTVTQTAGIRQQLPYGGEIVAQGLVSFINALNENVTDGETAELAIRGSIPLWRNAGMINLESLISSERELVYATRDFESYRRSFAVEVASRYFRVLTRYSSLRNRFTNYRNLLALVERTEALFMAGRVTALEVQRAQQSLLSAEDALNDAQVALQSDLDTFKVFIGMPVQTMLELTPIDVEVRSVDLNSVDPEELALKYRLELQTARDRVDDAQRGVHNAANQLGPSVDLTGGASISNPSGDPARKIDSRTLEYDVGLRVDLPVDRLPERNAYRQALIALERAKRLAVEVQESVLSEVRAAQREIRSAEYSLQIQQAGIDLARQRLDFANESLLLGRVTNSREVVEAQSSLLNAQDRYDQAKADLQIQLLRYLRDTGTLRVDPQAGILGLVMLRKPLDRVSVEDTENP
jgi:outer membrane protein TolC